MREMLAGTIDRLARRATNFLAIADLLGQTKVGVDKDGKLRHSRARKALGGQPRKWVEIGPFVWHDANGHELLAAKVVDGKADALQLRQLAPIIDLRPDALVPLVGLAPAAALRVARDPAADRRCSGRRGGSSAAVQARRSALERRRAAGPTARAGSRRWLILAVLVGWIVVVSAAVRRSHKLSASFDPILLLRADPQLPRLRRRLRW